ncbi:MAG: response regulator [Rhodanobacter sp.]
MNEAPKRSLRILIVEDELLIAASLEMSLEGHGHQVLGPVATVDAARLILETERPDLALLDYRLANSTTEPLLPELRQRGIPMCVLSGYGREQLPEAYADCQLVEKPFYIRQLLDTINSMGLRGTGSSLS